MSCIVCGQLFCTCPTYVGAHVGTHQPPQTQQPTIHYHYSTPNNTQQTDDLFRKLDERLKFIQTILESIRDNQIADREE